jgi:hypothetical protein
MVIAMACPAASPRTRPAAAPATPPDRQVWLAFINAPGIDAWIRDTFKQQWHWPKDRKMDARYDSVVNTAWMKLQSCEDSDLLTCRTWRRDQLVAQDEVGTRVRGLGLGETIEHGCHGAG